tara:strand:- start:1621 stop:2127 length:507 start_codon:yes stop_codon:yes gene_type:complete
MTDEFSAFYNTRQLILCSCPKCNTILRLSQLYIVSEGRKEKTWLDDFEEKIRKFQEKQGVIEQQATARRDAAVKRGREKVPKMIISSLSDKVVGTKYDPYDIKPINHPIDFIIYDGMNKASVENVIFLHQKNNNLSQLHKSIHETVENKKYDWKVARISKEGTLEIED